MSFSLEFALGPKGVPLIDLAQVLPNIPCEEFVDACPGFLLVQVPIRKKGGSRSSRATEDWSAGPPAGTLMLSPSHVWKLKEDALQARQAIVHLLEPEEGKPLLIGRAQPCDVVLAETSVSSRHAEIRVREDYETVWEISDLGSRNGTYVNGSKIGESDVVRLEGGENLWFSGYKSILLEASEFHALVTSHKAPE